MYACRAAVDKQKQVKKQIPASSSFPSESPNSPYRCLRPWKSLFAILQAPCSTNKETDPEMEWACRILAQGSGTGSSAPVSWIAIHCPLPPRLEASLGRGARVPQGVLSIPGQWGGVARGGNQTLPKLSFCCALRPLTAFLVGSLPFL